MAEGVLYKDGEYGSTEGATISLFDTGFLHSDAVHDVVSTWKGYFFKLDEHLERFERSCEGFMLTNPHSQEEPAAILDECVRQAEIDDAYVEIIVTRGEYPDGSRDLRRAENHFFAYAVPYVWIWGEEANRTGVNLHMSSVERISERAVDPRCKNFHWGDLLHAKRDAYTAGYDDAALCGPDGFLAEGPGFNIFVIKDGRVATPDSNCLEGVSGEAAIELCEMEAIPIECRKVRPEELSEADEAFATSTAGGIIPIVRIDGAPLGNGAPGLTTSRLAELYWSKREAGWCGRKVEDLIAQ